MKKIKKTIANGFYVFRGRSSADSSFIEEMAEARQFLIYTNYYLKNYLKIYDYVINQDGWQMIVKLNSEEDIYAAYFEKDIESIEVWRIISEQIRKCLSSYVVHINRKRGRTGSLVHSSYERFCFVTLKEAEEELKSVRNREIELGQKNKKYRGKKSHYRIPEKLGRGSVYLGSIDGKEKKVRVGCIELESFVNKGLSKMVLSKLVFNSKKNHFAQFKHSFSNKFSNSS